jgi:hypothetical protein
VGPPPNSGAGRSVTEMDYSLLTGAAAALFMLLGPSAISAEASTATVTAGAGASATDRPAAAATTMTVSGNVRVVVPGAAIASDDHLPAKLDRRRAYRAAFLMWVAPNARHPRLEVHADGGVVRGCSVSKLRPGVKSYLSCQVLPDPRHRGASAMTITVVVRTANLGTYSRIDQHQITN